MVGKGSDAGRRAALCENWPIRSLHGGRHPPLDEVTPALFDQRAVVAAADPEELEPTSVFADLLIKYENNGLSLYITILHKE